MNPAHFFTILRICISPLFPAIYLGYEWLGISIASVPYLLLSLLIVSEFSDIFDGFLARKRNQVTDLGKVLDPMADSITHISLFLAFTEGFVQLPLLIVLVFLYRDFFISTLRTLCALRGVALGARASGKVKAIMQALVAFLIVGLMIPMIEGHLSLESFQLISLIAISVAALYTAVSAIDYCYSNRLYIKKAVYPK
ncbi:MAG TPA: CDP-alcohol phosphatidyltransferase family protein [Chlamydiales bacterium]|jgi:CDP-diacylglycerol--glycerol-3-phosphate 3-phosphatidyltransferase|nr:CDP-alcohol phosphatidyltransferase family protein [Chlamydiales bacterium]